MPKIEVLPDNNKKRENESEDHEILIISRKSRNNFNLSPIPKKSESNQYQPEYRTDRLEQYNHRYSYHLL